MSMGDKENIGNDAFQGFSVPNTTPTPDELFDVVLAKITSLAELKVLLYTIRRTFGFKKNQDWIGNDQYVNGIVTGKGKVLDRGTGLSSMAVTKGIKRAVEHGYLIRVAQCPKCNNVVDGREKVVTRFKNRHTSKEVVKDVVIQFCPHCKEKLRGRERMVYGLNLKGAGYQTKLDTGIKLSLVGVSSKARTQETDVQETVLQEHVNVVQRTKSGYSDNGTIPDPRLDDVLTRMGERLGDTKQGSRVAFERILNVLGEPITERLVGNTLEMHAEGKISSTRAKYFMGMAKKVASEAGKDLGFKKGKGSQNGLSKPEETSMHAQIASMTAEIASQMDGNREVEPLHAEGEPALVQMFEAYQRRQRVD